MRGLKKKTVFSISLPALFDSSLEKTLAELSAAEAKAANNGSLGSGRMWLQRESILIQGVKDYANSLQNILVGYDPIHGAISSNDFDEAQVSIRKYSRRLEDVYEEKRNRKAFGCPETRPSFNGNRMTIALSEALLPIELAYEEYKSKRSIFKWAWGDAKKRLFTITTASIFGAIGMLVGPYIEGFFDQILKLIS